MLGVQCLVEARRVWLPIKVLLVLAQQVGQRGQLLCEQSRLDAVFVLDAVKRFFAGQNLQQHTAK